MSKKRKRREQQRQRREISSQEAAAERAEQRTGLSTRERRERRRSERARVRQMESREGMRRLHYRPYGWFGGLMMYLMGWLIVGGVLGLSWILNRWGYLGYLDSSWLYIAIGGVVAAPAIGLVARAARDTTVWSIQVTVVALAALVYERTWGPACGADATCVSFGAQGEWGVVGVALVMGISFALTMSISGLVHGWVADRRPPGSGSTRTVTAMFAMLGALALIGAPVAVAAVAIDATARSGPGVAAVAEAEVGLECFDLGAELPAMYVRPHPNPAFAESHTYLVGLEGDKRLKPDGEKYTNADRKLGPTPYEASVVATDDNRVLAINCRFIHPSVEQVDEAELASDLTAAQEYFPENEVLQPPVAVQPPPQPPGDPAPPEDEDGDAAAAEDEPAGN